MSISSAAIRARTAEVATAILNREIVPKSSRATAGSTCRDYYTTQHIDQKDVHDIDKPNRNIDAYRSRFGNDNFSQSNQLSPLHMWKQQRQPSSFGPKPSAQERKRHQYDTSHAIDGDDIVVKLRDMARQGDFQQSYALCQSLDRRRIDGKIANFLLQSIINSEQILDKGSVADRVWNQMVGVVQPNLIIYNCLMNAHAKSVQDTQRGKKAEQWLRRAQKEGLMADKISYTSVINAYALVGENLEDAERLFSEYTNLYAQNLATGPFSALMRGWSTKSRERTEELMDQILQYNLEPSIQAFMAVIKAQTCGDHIDAGERAYRWLLKYTEVSGKRPDSSLWNMVLHACARSGHPKAGLQADHVARRLFASGLRSETTMYNTWMDCWTKSRDANAVYRVQEILETLERLPPESCIQPNALSYSAAMQAWSKSELPEAPRRAEELLERMQKPQGQRPALVPILPCYEALMDAHARSSGGSQRVLQILDYVEKMAQSEKFSLRPRTYAAALLALSKKSDRDAIRQAEDIMTRMTDFGVSPNLHCYSLLITAYANFQGDTEGHHKALQALDRMKESGLLPNGHVYAAIITACANFGDLRTAKMFWEEAQESLQDRTVIFNALLNAFRLAGTQEAAEEAESLFRASLQLIEPNVVTFSTLICAWAEIGRVDRTTALLDQVKQDFPTYYTTSLYAIAINALNAHTTNESAPTKEVASHVELLLQELRQSGPSPDSLVLSAVIKAYIRHDDYQDKATACLKEMEDEYLVSGNASMKPPQDIYKYFASIIK